ncbi:rhomboid family intramembrane serine protease [Brevibacterium luteolum]|uniref:Rhomboid family intramembrane serine protease n=1 Tax=Brevibacterium luteolum TaxID=199591 RepID=A0A6G8KVU8_9MICO|nr:rhomboid family intramembrane serine protease [Brevibacterium luteolum]QIN28932.1 rhomboid family intramembrane serine protease [Brevibacterium luteolum]
MSFEPYDFNRTPARKAGSELDRPGSSVGARLLQPIVLLGLMWVIAAADFVLPGSFNSFGVRSWSPTGLIGIVFSPLLHSGWPHLIANTIPFLVLGLLVAAEGIRRYWFVTAVIALISGLGAWVVNLPGTLTVGASGLVFGYFGYLIMRAVFTDSILRRLMFGVIGLLVIILYGGSMLTGVLPLFPGISWQGHLFGAIGGGLAAWIAGQPRWQSVSGETTAPRRTGGLY